MLQLINHVHICLITLFLNASTALSIDSHFFRTIHDTYYKAVA